jgi:hypothetical protein
MGDAPAPGPPRTKITTTELLSKTGWMLSITETIRATCDGVEREGDRGGGAEERLDGIFLDA